MTTRDTDGETGRRQAGEGGEGVEEEETGPRRRSGAEWTTLAISILLILVLVGLVTRVSLGGDAPPLVEASPVLAEVRHEGESYYLPVAVTNRGGRTAEEVLITAELTGDDGSAEASEFTLDFLAGGETREGTVVFATDPATGELTVDVASFQ